MDSPRISKLLEQIVSNDPPLQFGLHHKLLNLSELARFLAPTVSARLGRRIQQSALVMALSRFQRALPAKVRRREGKFRLRSITQREGLAVVSFKNSSGKLSNAKFLKALSQLSGYYTLTQGLHEVSLILEERSITHVCEQVDLHIENQFLGVSALILRFDRAYIPRPGFLYIVLQQLALQQINIVEIASTATELILYLHSADTTRAAKALSSRFQVTR